MRITTKGRYALRALLHLADSDGEKPISIRQLSEEEDISAEFLEQLFFRLRKAGIISSTRGPGGGFRLKHPANKITTVDIFRAVGEGLYLTPCMPESGIVCGKSGECRLHPLWTTTYKYLTQYFGNITLEDIRVGNIPELSDSE